MKSTINRETARSLADLFGINLKVIPIKEWQYGLNVELEHGIIEPLTNVSNDDLIITAKIALRHLLEFPDYYRRLKKMEEQGDKYWKHRKKPSILE